MGLSKSHWMGLGIAVLGCLGCSGEPGPVAGDTQWSVLPVAVERQTTEPDPGQDRWSKALVPREFVFPRDHAAHRDYRIEWWYYTGNLESARGRRWGYQLTFFRTGLQFENENPSSWTVRDLYTAHFALSDIQRRDHRLAQRTSRQGIDFAGAQEEQYHVWNGDWRVRLEGERHVLEAKSDDFAISLSLHPAKPYVLHGEGGLSRKGPTPGNASYYYSATRMRTEGTITIDGQEHSVQGESWMDHEFSTSFLEPGQLGWDWFAIHLEDGTEIMLYQMRRDDGSPDPYSSGTYVDRQGRARRLHSHDFPAHTARPLDLTPIPRGSIPCPGRLPSRHSICSSTCSRLCRSGDDHAIECGNSLLGREHSCFWSSGRSARVGQGVSGTHRVCRDRSGVVDAVTAIGWAATGIWLRSRLVLHVCTPSLVGSVYCLCSHHFQELQREGLQLLSSPRSYREGGKVKHQTLGNQSHCPDLSDMIRRRLAQELPKIIG